MNGHEQCGRSEGPEILVLCANFGPASGFLDFVEHLRVRCAAAEMSFAVAVADNSASLPRSLPSQVEAFRPADNLGYMNGCAYALARWIESGRELPSCVALSNTDIEFAPDFFPRLRVLAGAGEAGILAPDISTPDGIRQNPFFRERPGILRMKMYCLVYSSSILTTLLYWASACRKRIRGGPRPYSTVDAGGGVYAPHGAFVLFPREFFQRGGTLAFDSFMFMEELHIAEQARRANLPVFFAPDLRITHYAHQSVSGVVSRVRRQWALRSARSTYRTYFDRPALHK